MPSSSNHHPAVKEVFVMCYASSGSSCVAGILHQLGINMGINLKHAQQLNPRGFYEDEDFFKILGRIWVRYHLSFPSRYDWDINRLWEISKKYQSEFQSIIGKRQNLKGAWGVKEPRLSLLIPAFKNFLINPFFIVVGRNVDSHAASQYNKMNTRLARQRFESLWYHVKKKHFSTLLSHGLNNIKNIGMTQDEAKHLVTSFYAHIDSIVMEQPHLYVNFDTLLTRPENTINEIIQALSLQPTQAQIETAVSFIAPELRHYA